MTTKNSDSPAERVAWRLVAVTAALLVVCLTGCRPQTVEGVVTLDGQPLPDGYIAFVPETGTKGPGAGARIEGGKFAVDDANKLFEGVYRVEITAKGETRVKTVDGSGRRRNAEGQILPARYNTKSTLTAEVKRKQANEFSFDLTSE
jgi:hypothetical protein